jgi:hypothetical protein
MNYDNDLDSDVWMRTTLSRAGAMSLIKVYKEKFNAELLEPPFKSEDGYWVFMITNPLKSMSNV